MALAALRSGSNGRKTKESGSAAPTLQSLKSGQTRARLIEATIRCIVKSGYSNTPTPQIANDAGLSRGAVLPPSQNGMAPHHRPISTLHERAHGAPLGRARRR